MRLELLHTASSRRYCKNVRRFLSAAAAAACSTDSRSSSWTALLHRLPTGRQQNQIELNRSRLSNVRHTGLGITPSGKSLCIAFPSGPPDGTPSGTPDGTPSGTPNGSAGERSGGHRVHRSRREGAVGSTNWYTHPVIAIFRCTTRFISPSQLL